MDMIQQVRSSDLAAKGSNSKAAARMATTKTEERNVDEEIAKAAGAPTRPSSSLSSPSRPQSSLSRYRKKISPPSQAVSPTATSPSSNLLLQSAIFR